MEFDDLVVNRYERISPVQRVRRTGLKQYDSQYYDYKRNTSSRKIRKISNNPVCNISKDKVDCEI